MKVLGVIPARWGSKRLPGKPLIKIKGKPMIQWVWENASKSKLLNELMVATDDERIYKTVRSFWGNAVMTSKKHKSGTDRVGEAVTRRNADIIVNIQGDEPFIEPKNIDRAVEALIKDKSANISTLAFSINNQKQINDPNVVKVLFDKNHNAVNFSRQPISQFKHIGLYVYRKDYLMKVIKMAQTKREKSEKLEQLRILENGGKIKVVQTRRDSVSVDTKWDLDKINKI